MKNIKKIMMLLMLVLGGNLYSNLYETNANKASSKVVPVSNQTKNTIILQNKIGEDGQFRDIDTIKSGETKSITFSRSANRNDIFYKFLQKYEVSFYIDDITDNSINFK